MDISTIATHVENILAKLDIFEQRIHAVEVAVTAPAPEPAPEQPAPQVQGEGSVPQAGAHE